MKERVYTSFEEIDRDLSILKLKRQIATEELKADVYHLRESMKPRELFADFIDGDLLKKFLLSWGIGYLLRKIKR